MADEQCKHTNTTTSGHITTCNDCGASWNSS